MINKSILILGISLLFFGCSTVKVKVEMNDYQDIDYAINVPQGYKKVTTIEIRKKGKENSKVIYLR